MASEEEEIMKFLTWLGVAAAALIVTSCASRVYDSGTPTSSRGYDARDFNGEWELVTGRSDNDGAWLDERSRFGADWGTTDGTSDRMRYGAWFLPDVFRIQSGSQIVRIEDEGGALIAEIPLEDSGYRYGSYDDQYNSNLRARWISDNRFEIERFGRNGRHVTQTFTLENRDRRLVVVTRLEREDTSSRTFTRVYERA